MTRAPGRRTYRAEATSGARVRVGSDVYSPVSDSTAAFVMVAIVVVGVVVAARLVA